jgi:hypothetical protein
MFVRPGDEARLQLAGSDPRTASADAMNAADQSRTTAELLTKAATRHRLMWSYRWAEVFSNEAKGRHFTASVNAPVEYLDRGQRMPP